MSSNKTNKATKKRVIQRKNGEFETRSVGHGHFNGKEGGRQQMNKRRNKKVVLTQKVLQRNLPHG